MPRFKSNNHQTTPKIKLLLQKIAKSRDPQWLPAKPKRSALYSPG